MAESHPSFLLADPGYSLAIRFDPLAPNFFGLDLQSKPLEAFKYAKYSLDFGDMNRFNPNQKDTRQFMARGASGAPRTLGEVFASAVGMFLKFWEQCKGLPELQEWHFRGLRWKRGKQATYEFLYTVRWKGETYRSHDFAHSGGIREMVVSLWTPEATIKDVLEGEVDETKISPLFLVSALSHSTVADFAKIDPRRLERIPPVLNEYGPSQVSHLSILSALAKIGIVTHKDPDRFLVEPDSYEHSVIGRFCEVNFPRLACIAYAKGNCDDEVIAITNNHSLFEEQVNYLIDRRERKLWSRVLAAKDSDKYSSLISQILRTPPEKFLDLSVVTMVAESFKYFHLHRPLVDFLENILLGPGTPFGGDGFLQDMLIFAAVCANRDKVPKYLSELKNYAPQKVAAFMSAHDMNDEVIELYRLYPESNPGWHEIW